MRPCIRSAALIVLFAAAVAPPSSARAQAPAQAASAPAPTKAELREIVTRWNEEWGRARVALDSATLNRMLPRDYVAIFGDQRMSRDSFLAGAVAPPPGVKLVRFEPRVLTLSQTPEGWAAVVQEKLEIDRTGEDGKVQRTYHLWVIRDLWKQVDGRWVLAQGEVISNEGWRGGTRPPFADW